MKLKVLRRTKYTWVVNDAVLYRRRFVANRETRELRITRYVLLYAVAVICRPTSIFRACQVG